jgi:hypothetical protein
MKIRAFIPVILLLSLTLYSASSTAAMLRWDLQPASFYNITGGTISGWFQFDSETPSPWSTKYDIRTTAADSVPIEGYRYFDSSIDPYRYSVMHVLDATHLELFGFNLSYRLVLSFTSSIFDPTVGTIRYEAVESNEFYGDRLANGQATATAAPLTSSDLYFLTGLSVLLFFSQGRKSEAAIAR